MGSLGIGHFSDEEFSGLNLDGLDESEFQRLARQGMPLLLPWHHESVRLGTGYHSNRQLTENPWASETPFVLAQLMMQAKIFRPEQGSTSSFTSKQTSSSAEVNDHLTLGFGLSLAPPIPVVKLSVMGKFDQQVQDNSDSEKSSIRATCRVGCIDLEAAPWLNTEAIQEIKYGGGFEGFCQRYGDYYLAGYRLGADTGMLLSGSSSSHKEVDQYSIKAEVQILFISVGASWEKDFEQFRFGRSLKLLGYDTLEGRNWENESKATDIQHEVDNLRQGKPQANQGSLRADAAAIMERSETMMERVGKILQDHNIENGSYVTFKQCEQLAKLGIVVELLLLPMARLRDVIQWRFDDNII